MFAPMCPADESFDVGKHLPASMLHMYLHSISGGFYKKYRVTMHIDWLTIQFLSYLFCHTLVDYKQLYANICKTAVQNL